MYGKSVLSIVMSLFLVLVVTQGVSIHPAKAEVTRPNVSSSCVGLSAYRGELLTAGRRWVKGMRRDGLLGRSTTTYTQDDWLAYNARAKRLVVDLKAIEPPEFVASWHQSQIKMARLRQNFAAFAWAYGFDTTAELYGVRVDAVRDELKTARQEASQTCPRFDKLATEWDRLDGHVQQPSSTAR